jgi:hypothetical protein
MPWHQDRVIAVKPAHLTIAPITLGKNANFRVCDPLATKTFTVSLLTRHAIV